MPNDHSQATDSTLLEQMRAQVGQPTDAGLARDPVNQAMIRHWCDAMSDQNPAYLDPSFAKGSIFGEIVAPPAMLNAWTMPGLVPRPQALDQPEGARSVYDMLDHAGFTSVVATDSTHQYNRYLKLGDRLRGFQTVTEVSEEKKTALGIGHFVTTVTEYRTQGDEVVGSMTFKILKFKPGTGRMSSSEGSDATAAPAAIPAIRPGISRDTQFFWDGLNKGELRIQKCNCGELHHPPVVRCPCCGSYDLGFTVASGRGTVYSFVEVHHPKIPGFKYPLNVATIELDEGTRLISNVTNVDIDKVEVGMKVECFFREVEDGYILPLFQPARPARSESTLKFDDLAIEDELAPCPIPITPTLIVATALASRDYQDVHHDRDLAKKRGSPDIFMNILTSSGLCGRFVSDWAGPEAVLKSLSIRLGVPNYPYDTMTMTGRVAQKETRDGQGIVTVEVRGANGMGNHLTGTVEIALP